MSKNGKLIFRYSAMNAGKSLDLIKTAYNYTERGMKVKVFNYEHDKRYGINIVASRVGVSHASESFNGDTIFYGKSSYEKYNFINVNCILVDEAQFLDKYQVFQLVRLKNQLNIPIICYGLRTDFQGELFKGSEYLLAWADSIEELTTVCHCGRKATFQIRKDEKGKRIFSGEKEQIGGNEVYESVCSFHFWEAMPTGHD